MAGRTVIGRTAGWTLVVWLLVAASGCFDFDALRHRYHGDGGVNDLAIGEPGDAAVMGGGDLAGVTGDLAMTMHDLSTVHDLSMADLTTPPPPCHLVINELSSEGPGGSADEFVEIYNPCVADADITNWQLAYRGPNGSSQDSFYALVTSGAPRIVAANGYFLIVGRSFSPTTSAPTFGIGGNTGVLGSAGGSVALFDLDQHRIDSLAYGTDNIYAEGGQGAVLPDVNGSVARVPNGHDTDHNRLDFQKRAPTPGASNGS